MNERKRELRAANLPEVTLSEAEVDLLELILLGLLAERDLPAPLSSRFAGPRPLALRDREGLLLAVLHEDRLEEVEPPPRYDFVDLRSRPDPRAGPYLAYPARAPLDPPLLSRLLQEAAQHRARLLVIADSAGEAHYPLVRSLQASLQNLEARLYLAPLSAAGDGLDQRIAENAGAAFFHAAPAAAPHRFSTPPAERGFAVFFTGLSGSGKSTAGNVLRAKLMELGPRQVTFLDGDIVRTHLSKGLGFSKEDRDLNILRIGFVASEIVKHGGVALCAPIAPYDSTRKQVRKMIEAWGDFVLVHVATPLEACEQRDRKGLYAKARRGELKGFTGIDDPYQAPADAEVVIDTSRLSREASAERVLEVLRGRGLI
jgi:sulfate adenylyltransferase